MPSDGVPGVFLRWCVGHQCQGSLHKGGGFRPEQCKDVRLRWATLQPSHSFHSFGHIRVFSGLRGLYDVRGEWRAVLTMFVFAERSSLTMVALDRRE